MANVFDVAKYILDNYGAMSAMKLQKLCYYSQAMSLVWDDVPLFDEEFEAWAKGPVCRELFNAHKGKFMLEDSAFLEPFQPNVEHLSNTQKETINAVVGGLVDLPAYRLSELAHSEAPWKNARGNCSNGERCSNVIPKDAMMEFYADNW